MVSTRPRPHSLPLRASTGAILRLCQCRSLPAFMRCLPLACTGFQLWRRRAQRGPRAQYWPTSSSRCPARPREARRARRYVSKSFVDGPRGAVCLGRRFVVEPRARGPAPPVIERGLPGLGRGRYPLALVVAHVCRCCLVSFARMVMMHGDVEGARAVCLVLRAASDGTGWYAALDGRLTVHSARI